MADWRGPLPLWAAAWVAVPGQSSDPEGSGVLTAPAGDGAPSEYILAWPGADADRAAEMVRQNPGVVLTLVTGESGDALGYAAARDLDAVHQEVLLIAPTVELRTVATLGVPRWIRPQ
jgi:hypothetical protein